MLSNLLARPVYFLILINTFIIHSTFSQDSLSIKPGAVYVDSSEIVKPSSPKEYKSLLYVGGIFETGRNGNYYQNFYNKGLGLHVGATLFSHKYYTVRFNIIYSTFKFQKAEYLKTDSLKSNETVKGKNLETISFSPEILIYPLNKYLFSPYISLGAGAIVGAVEPTIYISKQDKIDQEYKMPFGTRLIGQFGIGGKLDVLPYLKVLGGVSYNFEFLENNQPEDIFYKFRKIDTKYKFVYYSLGIELSIRQ